MHQWLGPYLPGQGNTGHLGRPGGTKASSEVSFSEVGPGPGRVIRPLGLLPEQNLVDNFPGPCGNPVMINKHSNSVIFCVWSIKTFPDYLKTLAPGLVCIALAPGGWHLMMWCSPDSARERAATAGQNMVWCTVDSARYVFSVRVGSELVAVISVSWALGAGVMPVCSHPPVQGAGLAMVGPTSGPWLHIITPATPGSQPDTASQHWARHLSSVYQLIVKVESVSHRARGHGSKRTGPAPAAEDVPLPWSAADVTLSLSWCAASTCHQSC